MTQKRTLTGGALFLIMAMFVFQACSDGSRNGGEGSNGDNSGSSLSTVALYATDGMADYKQVIATINMVQLKHTGSGAACNVLSTQMTINIANLANELQLLSVAQCPAVPYNRIHIGFNKSVDLMDALDTKATCSFASYKDGSNHPNVLQCDGMDCSLDVNGAVNVLVNHANAMALDFDLKHFDVDHFGTPSCSVTMKVSPLHGDGVEKLHHHKGITGVVSGLTVSTKTFTLATHHTSFNVLYSSITPTGQPGLNDLLLRAQEDGLRTRVTSTGIDFVDSTIVASAIAVKVEGMISDFDGVNKTFTLTYKKGKTLKINFNNAVTKGLLADDAWVEVKLYGYDSMNEVFLAGTVEVEFESSAPKDHKKEMNTED